MGDIIQIIEMINMLESRINELETNHGKMLLLLEEKELIKEENEKDKNI